MSRYSVVGVVTGSKHLGTFEANSPEEAINLALESEAAHVGLCHQCCCECEDPSIETALADEVGK